MSFTIGDIQVGEEVPTISFACDLLVCRGACCTLPGGRGAPLADAELAEIRRALPIIRKYVSPDHLHEIEQHGYIEGSEGHFATRCIDDRACVFVFYERGVAKCSFEKAFNAGEIEWRKPISCHLFPLRADSGMLKRIRFEYLFECEPALRRGKKEDVPVYAFLKDALLRAYGEEWYRDFVEECERRVTEFVRK